ncbi:MAG: FtsX-like permease family protein [Thermodesulfovibrionales bacterium]|nr:FtsX-like permease family protein [Thermodesulfovibrionales bacterium]
MQILKLLLKNSFRHKLRTSLTVFGITIAILAFGLLRTVVSAWYAGVEASSATRLITRNSISIIFFLPLSYKEKIRQIPGVKNISYSCWFGGIYISEKNFIPNFAVDAKTVFELWPEFVLTEKQKNDFLHDRKACVAGRKVAEKYGWKIGDTITLRGTIFPGNWDFTLRGIYKGAYKSSDETQFFFHWDYLNESMKKTSPNRADQVGWYVVGVKNPDLAADVAAAIDKTFKNSLAETITETEKAFQQGFVSMTEAIVIAVRIVSFVVIIIIMAVMANTMAMTARERIGEYAIMKTLGFGGWHIAGLIFGESLIIAFTGCAFGIAATYPAAKAFGDAMSTYFPIFNVQRETIYMDIAASLVVGLVAAVFPAWRAVKVSIADGLRRIG